MRVLNDNDITMLSRLVESSPVIVVLCLGFIALLLRWLYRTEVRLEQKDEQIIRLQRETLSAMHEVTIAVNKLTEALRNSR